MGTFSPVHWIIALSLLAAVSAFVYLVGSLLWAGAKEKGKGKLVAISVLLPVVLLAVYASMGASSQEDEPIDWDKGVITKKARP